MLLPDLRPARVLPVLATAALTASVAMGCGGAKDAASASATDRGADIEATAAKTNVTSVRLDQGGCFGTCPVYSLSVTPDGSARYHGKRYAPFKGVNLGTVPADTMARLLRLAEAVLAKADQLPREIDTGIQDHSYSAITFTTATDTLEFGGTIEFAPPVDTIRGMLMRMDDYVGFAPDPDAEPVPKNELRIRLRSSDQIQVVQEEFFRQEFKVLELEDRATSTFRVSFDPYTMSAEEMVRVLESRPEVVSAAVIE